MQGPHDGVGHSSSWMTHHLPYPRPYPMFAPPGEIENDEVDENDRFMADFLNGRSVIEVRTYPNEILQSDERLFALFKVWKKENQLYFPPGRENARRFEGFKKTVFKVHKAYVSGHQYLGIGRFAAFLPSDPCPGCHVTEEEGERLKPFRLPFRPAILQFP